MGREAGIKLPPDAFVFSPYVEGTTPFRPDNVTSFFIRVRNEVGAPHVRLHDLRHFTATQLIGAGVDVRTVAGRLGHSDPSVTLRVYSHALEERDRAAAAVMGGILDPSVRRADRLHCRFRRRSLVPRNPALNGLDGAVSGDAWQLEVYETEDGRQPFTVWVDKLPETKFVSLDAALRIVLSERGLDLARTEWLKPLGEGLHEFRVRHDADEIRRMFAGDQARGRRRERILLRVFVHFHGTRVVLLLGGYDKGKDPSERRQQREIGQARKYLADWRRGQRK